MWSRLPSWSTGWIRVPFAELGSIVVMARGREEQKGWEALDTLNLRYCIGILDSAREEETEAERRYHVHEVPGSTFIVMLSCYFTISLLSINAVFSTVR